MSNETTLSKSTDMTLIFRSMVWIVRMLFGGGMLDILYYSLRRPNETGTIAAVIIIALAIIDRSEYYYQKQLYSRNIVREFFQEIGYGWFTKITFQATRLFVFMSFLMACGIVTGKSIPFELMIIAPFVLLSIEATCFIIASILARIQYLKKPAKYPEYRLRF